MEHISQCAEVVELRIGKKATLCKRHIQCMRGVTLAENEAIPPFPVWLPWVDSQPPLIEKRQNIDTTHRCAVVKTNPEIVAQGQQTPPLGNREQRQLLYGSGIVVGIKGSFGGDWALPHTGYVHLQLRTFRYQYVRGSKQVARCTWGKVCGKQTIYRMRLGEASALSRVSLARCRLREWRCKSVCAQL